MYNRFFQLRDSSDREQCEEAASMPAQVIFFVLFVGFIANEPPVEIDSSLNNEDETRCNEGVKRQEKLFFAVEMDVKRQV